MSNSGSSTGDETSTGDDVSLNDLSANHNNDLFAGTVGETCVDALARMEIAAETCAKDLEPLHLEPLPPNDIDDTEYLLAGNGSSNYRAPEDSANLWNKAMTTMAKGKCNKTAKQEAVDMQETGPGKIEPGSRGTGRLSAYDMTQIIDGSINGGEATSQTKSKHKVASSEFSIDGESAILWGDDPEKAYFAYMLEQEAEQRAMEGKDQDDSLMADSTRKELMEGLGGGASSLEDDTTLGNTSKVLGHGWDPSTIAGPSQQISSLTPSFNNPSSQQRDKDGRLIIPNVIYVQDGTDPNPQVKPRTWGDEEQDKHNKSSRSKKAADPPRFGGTKSKAAADRLEEEDANAGNRYLSYKSGWYANRVLIGAALFFLVLTTGLVVVLILYRNHLESQTPPPASIANTNLGANGNPYVPPPSVAPIFIYTPPPSKGPTEAPSPAPFTVRPTIDLFKKNDNNFNGGNDQPVVRPTWEPTWFPTPAEPEPTPDPTWDPTEAPTWAPTRAPTARPTWSPSFPPSTTFPTRFPTFSPTKVPSHSPTVSESELPTEIFVSSGTPTDHQSFAATGAPSIDPSTPQTLSPTNVILLVDDDDIFLNHNNNTEAPESSTMSPSTPASASPTTVPTSTASPSSNPTPTALAALDTPAPSINSNPMTPSSNPTPTALALLDTLSPSINPTEAPSTATLSSSPSTITNASSTSDISASVLSPTNAPSAELSTATPTATPTVRPTPRPPTTPSPTANPSALPTQPPRPQPSARAPTALPPMNNPTPVPSHPPTPQPTSGAPITATPTGVPAYVALDSVRNFLTENSPMSTAALYNTTSSQYAALVWMADWMASIPAAVLGRITKKRLIQRWSLAVLYLELNGPNWLNGSEDWMGNASFCKWLRDNNQGNCNSEFLVENLDLSNNNLRGSLPREIANLGTSITRMVMDRNDISGPMPEQFGRLRSLVSLDFTRCDLTGTLPTEIGNLQSLAVLGLGRNDLTGTIPTQVGNLTNLVYLGLERNDLGGTIPLELAYLQNLEYLALDWNALTGSVPLDLRNLSKLRSMILARNELVGTVPPIFCERKMDFLAADCDEVSCPCCDLCCEDGTGCAST